MEKREITCDKCKKRVDNLQNDDITYFVVIPIKGQEMANAKAPLSLIMYSDMYHTRHYCWECFNQKTIN